MVEIATTRVFSSSDPVEAVDYDAQTSRLAISSHHGNVTLYEVGRNGEIFLLAMWQQLTRI